MVSWILSLSFIVPQAFATLRIEACPSSSCAAVLSELYELVPLKFPRLAERKIRVDEFEETGSYFRTDVDHVLASGRNRTYVVRVNPALFKANPAPSRAAIRAILIHELSHLNDYTQMSSLEIAELGLRYVLNDEQRSVAEYERATDRVSLMMGFGEGLIEYRRWLYQLLAGDRRALRKKQRLYLRPDEIQTALRIDEGLGGIWFEPSDVQTAVESNSYEGWCRRGQVSSEK